MRVRRGFATPVGFSRYVPPAAGNRLITELLEGTDPVMVGRYGTYELRAVARCALPGSGVRRDVMTRLHKNAGFFPRDEALLPRFAKTYLDASSQIDCFSAWNFRHGLWNAEELAYASTCPRAILTDIQALDFFRYDDPWTAALRDRKVLVVHPFKSTIECQYQKRHLLFPTRDMLPDFKSLAVVQAVQSIGGNPAGFDDWFAALEYMCGAIDEVDYDVAIIGAGAYGLPLAAHAKRSGKSAVVLGGVTQILFGIMGRRWERRLPFRPNVHWVRPGERERPAGFERIEGGCYW